MYIPSKADREFSPVPYFLEAGFLAGAGGARIPRAYSVQTLSEKMRSDRPGRHERRPPSPSRAARGRARCGGVFFENVEPEYPRRIQAPPAGGERSPRSDR